MRQGLKTGLSQLVLLSGTAFVISAFSPLPSFGMTEEKTSHHISAKTQKREAAADNKGPALKKQRCDPTPVSSSQPVTAQPSAKSLLNRLPKDLGENMGSFLGIPEIASLALISKQQKTTLGEWKLWGNFTSKSGISLSTMTNITGKNSKEVFLICLSQNYRAKEVFVSWLWGKKALKNALKYIEEIVFDSTVPDDNKVKALEPLPPPKRLQDVDVIVYALFNRISLSQELSPRMRGHASLSKVGMRIIRRTEAIDDATAYALLHELSQSQEAHPNDRASASFGKALMRLLGQTQAIDNVAAYALLDEVSQSQMALPRIRARASFYKAAMKLVARTTAIDDAEAYTLLHGVSQNQEAIPGDRAKASLCKAAMRVQRRTEEIDNAAAYALLHTVSQAQTADPNDRARASLYKAMMKYERQTEAIDDAAAYALFHDVSQNPAAAPEDRATASLSKALMKLNGRTQAIDDAAAYTLLREVTQNQEALPEDRDLANSIIEALKSQGRVPASSGTTLKS